MKKTPILLLCLHAASGQALTLSDEALSLRDAQGRKIGQLTENGQKIEARDCRGLLAGWYDPAVNQTRDAKGQLAGQGFLLPRLIQGCP